MERRKAKKGNLRTALAAGFWILGGLATGWSVESRAGSADGSTFCSEFYGGEMNECQVTPCPSDFQKLIGVWDGKSETWNAEMAQLSPQETRLVFSKNACLKNSGKAESVIVGRQTVISLATPRAASKTENTVFVYGKKEDRDLEFIRTVNNQGSMTEFGLVSVDEKEGKRTYFSEKQGLTWTEKKGSPSDQKIHTKFSDASGKVLAQGFKRPLKGGEVSYFAGTYWVFTSNGDLIERNDSLLARNSDPKAGQISQKETLFDRQNRSLEPREANLAAVVTHESVGSLENVKNSKQRYQDGSAIESTDVETGNALYSEQRLLDESGQLLKTFVRTAARIDRDEYDKQMRAVLKNCSQCTARGQPGMR